MNLTEKPTTIQWPETHYVFIEKIGPFQKNAPQAWQELHAHWAEIAKSNDIITALSLYDPKKNLYRAGLSLKEEPLKHLEGVDYIYFEGGKYARFTLKGSYSQLPEACGRVFEIVKQTNMKVRDDLYIEHYVNDPKTTPEADLITEILVPLV